MIQAKLLKNLWAETLNTAYYLVNLSPSSAIDFKTPYQMWAGQIPSYAHLKVFGCQAYAHINQGKLAPRALKGVFIGNPDGVKGYKLWCIISRDVVFNEGEVADKLHRDKYHKLDQPDSNQFEVETSYLNNPRETLTSNDTSGEVAGSHTSQDYQLVRDKEKRKIRAPKRYGYAAHEIDVEEPKSFEEAIKC